jgi:hypothetical protein
MLTIANDSKFSERESTYGLGNQCEFGDGFQLNHSQPFPQFLEPEEGPAGQVHSAVHEGEITKCFL